MSQNKYTCTCGWNVYGKSSTKKCKPRGTCGEAWCPAAVSAGTVRDPPKKLADKTQAAEIAAAPETLTCRLSRMHTRTSKLAKACTVQTVRLTLGKSMVAPARNRREGMADSSRV